MINGDLKEYLRKCRTSNPGGPKDDLKTSDLLEMIFQVAMAATLFSGRALRSDQCSLPRCVADLSRLTCTAGTVFLCGRFLVHYGSSSTDT